MHGQSKFVRATQSLPGTPESAPPGRAAVPRRRCRVILSAMFFHLLLLFTLVPILEIWLLIRIGQAIDVGPTIVLVIATGVIGAALARREGLRTLTRINESLARGIMPAAEMVEGLMITVAGVALVTPGVVTDAIGLAILIPPVRAWLRRRLTDYFKKRVTLIQYPPGPTGPSDKQFIDVEVRDVTDQYPSDQEPE